MRRSSKRVRAATVGLLLAVGAVTGTVLTLIIAPPLIVQLVEHEPAAYLAAETEITDAEVVDEGADAAGDETAELKDDPAAPEVDAALRGLAHDLRSPIAAAAAAFAAVDDHVDGMADDDVGYFCGVVRQNLREATARLKTLEEYRLHPPARSQGPGLRQASARRLWWLQSGFSWSAP